MTAPFPPIDKLNKVEVHILNVGQGNMNVVIFPDNFVLVYDCNITQENQLSVLAYLIKIMPKDHIDVFINSHRDADHMRGIKKLNAWYPIGTLWDSGVSGNTDTSEYRDYMDFRRSFSDGSLFEAYSPGYLTGKPYVKVLNGKRDDLTNPNEQSIVLHINYLGSGILLTGDTNSVVWEDHIIPDYGNEVNSIVLVASHHGSMTFFNDRGEESDDYLGHVSLISPAITVISVGNNSHGHPDFWAVEYYKAFSHGTVNNSDLKIFRTDLMGNIKINLEGNGLGTVYWNQ